MTRVVLVTGAGRYLGGRVAARLSADPQIGRVVAVDHVPPVHVPLGRAEFVRADVRHPILARILVQARVDTVVHTLPDPISAGALAEACEQAGRLRRVVLRSSTRVYGAAARRPGVIGEDEPTRPPHDAAEEHLRALARHRPDVSVALLRLAEVVGPGVDTPLVRRLAGGRPVPVPTPIGHDRRVQLLHEIDAVEVLAAMCASEFAGPLNVAADGVLTWSQAVRRVGRVRLPVPAAAYGSHSADERFGTVVDTSRLRELGLQPRHTTAEALRSCLPQRRSAPALVAATAAHLAARLEEALA